MAPIQHGAASLVHLEEISQYVPLPPLALANPHPALCSCVFSPLLLSYYPPARGVVLAYQNVKLSDEPPMTSNTEKSSRQNRPRRAMETERRRRGVDSNHAEGQRVLLRHLDEYSAPFVWATADLLVWRPRRGAWIEARITHQSSTHITLSHLNVFTISVLKQNLPSDWSFHIPPNITSSKPAGAENNAGAEGYWVDGDGMPLDNVLRVRIRDWDGRSGAGDSGKGFIKIEGSLLTDEEEKAGQEQGRKKRRKSALRQHGQEGGEQEMSP